jgi:hypothetical protein
VSGVAMRGPRQRDHGTAREAASQASVQGPTDR